MFQSSQSCSVSANLALTRTTQRPRFAVKSVNFVSVLLFIVKEERRPRSMPHSARSRSTPQRHVRTRGKRVLAHLQTLHVGQVYTHTRTPSLTLHRQRLRALEQSRLEGDGTQSRQFYASSSHPSPTRQLHARLERRRGQVQHGEVREGGHVYHSPRFLTSTVNAKPCGVERVVPRGQRRQRGHRCTSHSTNTTTEQVHLPHVVARVRARRNGRQRGNAREAQRREHLKAVGAERQRLQRGERGDGELGQLGEGALAEDERLQVGQLCG